MYERFRSNHSWQAVSATAAALAAVVALAAYVWPNSTTSTYGGTPPASSCASSTATTAEQAAVSTVESSPSAPASSQDSTVLAQAVLRLSGDGSVDLDTMPLTVDENGGGDYSFTTGSGQIDAGITTSLAGWPGPGTPTAAQCEDLLRTQPVSSLEDHTGLIFCAKGLDIVSPHVGFGQVVSYDGNVSQINVTVWSATLKN